MPAFVGSLRRNVWGSPRHQIYPDLLPLVEGPQPPGRLTLGSWGAL